MFTKQNEFSVIVANVFMCVGYKQVVILRCIINYACLHPFFAEKLKECSLWHIDNGLGSYKYTLGVNAPDMVTKYGPVIRNSNNCILHSTSYEEPFPLHSSI